MWACIPGYLTVLSTEEMGWEQLTDQRSLREQPVSVFFHPSVWHEISAQEIFFN